uniref:sigma factor n=1 Tax=Nocardia farcinica TaxID=37329 RepID=UPI002454AD3C
MSGPAVDAVYRAEFGRALATVARLVGDIAAAEDAVQEAFAEALLTWPARGTPANPGAWITTVAPPPPRARFRRRGPPPPPAVEAAPGRTPART